MRCAGISLRLYLQRSRAGTVKQGVSVGPKGDNLGNYKDAVEDETEEGKQRADERAAERNQANAIAAFKRGADPNENFPITNRVPEGEGLRVLKEVPSILGSEQ